jgi:hypothetical protein
MTFNLLAVSRVAATTFVVDGHVLCFVREESEHVMTLVVPCEISYTKVDIGSGTAFGVKVALLFARKITKMVMGDARYDPQMFLNTLGTLAIYVIMLTLELSSNWIVSYIKIGGRGEAIIFTMFEIRNMSIYTRL